MGPVRAKNGRFQSKKQSERKEKVSNQAKLLVARARNKKAALKEKCEPVKDAGRRVVDLAVIANKMWCFNCDIPLSFRGLEEEMQRGLASIFHVRCGQCLDLVKVPSSSTVKTEDSTYPLYSVNCKAAAGCIESGIGHDQLNNFLSALNCPIIHHTTMKRAEERVGHSFESTANESCKAAVLEEKALTISDRLAVSAENPEDLSGVNEDAAGEVGITVEYDFGWDTRGSGFDYNSKSGRGSVIGHKTHRVLSWEVMSNACAMCAKGHKPDDHDCRRNHSGSSKSMEPQAAVNLMAKNKVFKDNDVRVDVLVGDEDASTYCHVQQQTAHHVEKWIDTNHTTKKFNNKLYNLAKKHRFLTSTVIKYLKRCFCYAIGQNRGNVNGLKLAFKNIVCHTFGEHEACNNDNRNWCKARDNSEYVFKHLPEGKPFSCPLWRTDFELLMESYIEKAEKIAPGGSSQRNESFNHMVVTRAPKSRFYGFSPALGYRVAAAVLQKNEGANHLNEVNRKAGLSPGGITQKYRAMIQERREKKASRQQSIEYKKRRLFHKAKTSAARVSQRKEGFSYVSGMSTTMERAVATTRELNAWIPDSVPLENHCVTVVVDTETTGVGGSAEIVQIAARCGNAVFEAYMFPTQKINPQASEKTGLTTVDGFLCHYSKKVKTTPSADVARDFLQFLHNCGRQIVLVGHNLVRFDAPLILRWMQQHSLARALCSLVYGFTDTIPLLRQGKVAKQELLAKKYLTGAQWDNIHGGAHNASVDCVMLSGLLEHFNISADILKDKAIPKPEFLERQALAKKQKVNLPGLATMKGVVSQQMLSKMARCGITIEELKKEFELHGRKGVEVSLGVRINGKPRITTHKKIVRSVCDFLCKLCTKSN